MNAKKILLQAARKESHRKEVERMTEAEAAEFLRKLTGKKEQ